MPQQAHENLLGGLGFLQLCICFNVHKKKKQDSHIKTMISQILMLRKKEWVATLMKSM